MSHISDGRSGVFANSQEGGTPDLPFQLTGSQAKTAFALRHNAERMIAEAGLESIGFLTLTVGDSEADGFSQVWDGAEASRRINNLNRHILPLIFERAIVVTERHKSGAIHFHLLGVLKGRPDIRSGFDFEAVKAGDYGSASPALRGVWEFLRERLPAYGFGRSELQPVKKTGEAVAAYVSKYIEKNLFNRRPEDRRKKLVRYLGFADGHLKAADFAWNTPRARAWRGKAAILAGLGGCKAHEDAADAFGPRWAFRLTRVMHAVDDSPEPRFAWRSVEEREAAQRLVIMAVKKQWLRSTMPCTREIQRRVWAVQRAEKMERDAADGDAWAAYELDQAA